jgi:hypothetical protein
MAYHDQLNAQQLQQLLHAQQQAQQQQTQQQQYPQISSPHYVSYQTPHMTQYDAPNQNQNQQYATPSNIPINSTTTTVHIPNNTNNQNANDINKFAERLNILEKHKPLLQERNDLILKKIIEMDHSINNHNAKLNDIYHSIDTHKTETNKMHEIIKNSTGKLDADKLEHIAMDAGKLVNKVNIMQEKHDIVLQKITEIEQQIILKNINTQQYDERFNKIELANVLMQ